MLAPPSAGRVGTGRALRWLRDSDLPIIAALGLLVLYFALTAPFFLSVANLTTILYQIAELGIVAIGETFVILIAGIDLSVGSILALTGILSATLALKGLAPPLAMLSAIAMGALLGFINGAATYWLRMASFIVTLAMLSMAGGYALVFTNGSTVYGFPTAFNVLGSGTLVHIPVSILVLFGMFAAGYVVLRYTVFGRNIYAVGGNAEAARLSGINVSAVGIAVFTISGALSGLASLIDVGRLASATPIAGQSLNLSAIAAVVIGGTSLFGGIGRLTGTFVGVLLIGVLNNGLAIANVSAFWDETIQGLVIFAAVLIDVLLHRRRQ